MSQSCLEISNIGVFTLRGEMREREREREREIAEKDSREMGEGREGEIKQGRGGEREGTHI